MLSLQGTEDGLSENGPGSSPRPGYRLKLREMAPDERPRERMKLRGAAALSDGDLIAIILNTGVMGTCRVP